MLLADDRRCGTRARDRVRVTMNELPAPTLQSKHAGHADCDRYYLVRTLDLGSAALHFDDAGESFGYVLRYEFDPSTSPSR